VPSDRPGASHTMTVDDWCPGCLPTRARAACPSSQRTACPTNEPAPPFDGGRSAPVPIGRVGVRLIPHPSSKTNSPTEIWPRPTSLRCEQCDETERMIGRGRGHSLQDEPVPSRQPAERPVGRPHDLRALPVGPRARQPRIQKKYFATIVSVIE